MIGFNIFGFKHSNLNNTKIGNNMMLINAGIRTKEEAFNRLVAGETLYSSDDVEIKYKQSNVFKGNSPFSINGCSVVGSWDTVVDWKIEDNWQDYATKLNPVICYVWIRDGNNRKQSIRKVYVVRKKPYVYLATNGSTWEHAEPVKPSECYGY